MRLRILIARRAEHPDRLVSPQLDGWLTGAIGLRKGASQEVDEFSRADKRALIRAAWADVRALEPRLQHGSELLATGRDPRVGGWLVPANLLWAIENHAPRNNWRRTLVNGQLELPVGGRENCSWVANKNCPVADMNLPMRVCPPPVVDAVVRSGV